ncbi:MAG TPA: condensation domain-containing protein [Candidatus Kapabacteria bacterium]|nr:condensation domain-containing protein [Candidatus Kapabacteria bacterium]
MIIKKFIEQVERFYEKTAIKKGDKELSYGQLNEYSDKIARGIADAAGVTVTGGQILPGKEHQQQEIQQVALLFEHGIDMIAALLGVLKTCKAYVPLDIFYPLKRQLYIVENAGIQLLLTNNVNFQKAQELIRQAALTGREIRILNIDDTGSDDTAPFIRPETAENVETAGDRIAYILYTSGSTGKPKGVYQTHRNVLYYTRNWIRRFSLTPGDRMSLFTSFTHDGCVQDIFSALLSGACLYPYSLKEGGSLEGLYLLLFKEKITLWHSVPSLYRFFGNSLTEKDQFYDLRWLLLGGEPLREYDLRLYRDYFPNARLGNVYGQTESSVNAIFIFDRKTTYEDMYLGEPLDETQIMLIDENGNQVETMGIGEIVVASHYLAPGYWRAAETGSPVFTYDEEMGTLYWTGDQGRLTAEDRIKIMGRTDFQVKVRGFRIETGEIETALLNYRSVKEAVVIAKPETEGDNYLCAYLVTGGNEDLSPGELRKYLAEELPDYMIPRYFTFLEKMPLNFSGKIDRQSLPDPQEEPGVEMVYAAPTNEIETKVAEIWQEVLGVEKVGIDDNFIQLGGHSLLVISIISRVHQEFDVELQLMDVFTNPTVRELAQLVRDTMPSLFAPIEPAEEKEYYVLTSGQERIFILNHFEGIGTTYNITGTIPLGGDFDLQRFEQTLCALIKRHESLRTSFREVNGQPVQVIHKEVDFQIPYIDAGEKSREIVRDFVRPFDLSCAPLLRASIVKPAQNEFLLLLDTHHIISDGVSYEILIKEFSNLYEGEELPQLKLRYRDYAEWEKDYAFSGRLKKQEEYWLEIFKGELPVLNLPLNYPRPEVQDFTGDIVLFALEQEIAGKIDQLVKETGTTLFMVLLTMYYILLYKYTGQEDIIIGTINAGRNHVDLENVVGMFVKTLPLRNRPAAGKTFDSLLQEVKINTLKAFEKQDYPFSQLVKELSIDTGRSRNPLFDAAFVLQSKLIIKEKRTFKLLSELPPSSSFSHSSPYGYQIKTAKFDLTFEAIEGSNGIFCTFQYCSKLFKRETIQLMKERFLILVKNILNNRQAKIQDLEYMVLEEKEFSDIKELTFNF